MTKPKEAATKEKPPTRASVWLASHALDYAKKTAATVGFDGEVTTSLYVVKGKPLSKEAINGTILKALRMAMGDKKVKAITKDKPCPLTKEQLATVALPGTAAELTTRRNIAKLNIKNLTENLERAVQEEKAIAEKIAKGQDAYDVFKQLSASGRWSKFVVDQGKLWFTTAENVIITHKQKKYDLGRYAFRLHGSSLSAWPFSKNKFHDDTYHPYIHGGEICWGNFYQNAAQILQTGRLSDLGLALDTLLHYYGSDVTPQVDLEDLFRPRPKKKKRVPGTYWDDDDDDYDYWSRVPSDDLKRAENTHPALRKKVSVLAVKKVKK